VKDNLQVDGKSKIRYIFLAILIFVIIQIVELFKNWSVTTLFVSIGLDILILLYLSLSKTFNAVTFDSQLNIIVLEFTNLFNNTTKKQTSIRNVEYSYKKESKFRSSPVKTLKLFIKGEKTIKIYRDDDGWSEELLDNLVILLDKYNVSRKFTGYALQDEYPVENNITL
jgi:hypothetical protein